MVAPSAAVDSTEIEISEAAAPASALSDVPTTADPNASNQETLAALAASIHRIGQDMERFRETAERRAAEGFGAAAAQCVPSLATEGFTREVTAAVLNIARELRTETATLLLPPDDVQAVAGALNERNPEIAFTLAGDPSLAPGTARITWPKGGAALSADRLAEAAMDIFHRHLSSPAPALQPTAETVPTTEPQPH
ncbi:MAG: FliH/SctL family protein [Pseudomonadota bacterium]